MQKKQKLLLVLAKEVTPRSHCELLTSAFPESLVLEKVRPEEVLFQWLQHEWEKLQQCLSYENDSGEQVITLAALNQVTLFEVRAQELRFEQFRELGDRLHARRLNRPTVIAFWNGKVVPVLAVLCYQTFFEPRGCFQNVILFHEGNDWTRPAYKGSFLEQLPAATLYDTRRLDGVCVSRVGLCLHSPDRGHQPSTVCTSLCQHAGDIPRPRAQRRLG